MDRFEYGFFARDTLSVARDLLGARLVRAIDGQRLSGVIVECEAYVGQDDSACHASRGRTQRNAVMFGPPGRAYVYFVYGMHHMLNVVTEQEGFPAAVLLRAIQPLEGLETMRRLRLKRGQVRSDHQVGSGPARLTQALDIDRSLNGADLVQGEALWLERADPVPGDQLRTGPRIGINYARPQDLDAPWRFWVDANPHVSGKGPDRRR